MHMQLHREIMTITPRFEQLLRQFPMKLCKKQLLKPIPYWWAIAPNFKEIPSFMNKQRRQLPKNHRESNCPNFMNHTYKV
jgi:hypothetical protein